MLAVKKKQFPNMRTKSYK